MTDIIALLLALAAGALLIPVATFAVEIVAAALGARKERSAPGLARPGLTVLIPAHNEELGLAETLACIAPQLGERDRILVVADNCTDRTAEIARAHGAETIERFDERKRGKGFALAFGVAHLERQPPDIVVIVDADCKLEPGALDALGREVAGSGRPAQALYLMKAPAGAGLSSKVAEFAFLVKNLVRPRGLRVLGAPCHLTGSGMAFPWETIRRADLAHGHIVEDMKLGLDLALTGHGASFCEDARVESVFPQSQTGSASQRRRWEQGHLSLMGAAVSHMGKALGRGRWGAFFLSLDVMTPPLALLVLSLGAVLVASIVCGLIWGGMGAATTLAAAGFAILAAAVLIAWARFGRGVLSGWELLAIAPYALRKLALYPALLFTRSAGWVRTQRDAPKP